MTGTLTRPNANRILAMMRDDDFSDPWGTAMSWGFAVCDVLYDADPNMVPASLEYRPAMAGPEVPTGSAELELHRVSVEDIPSETAMVWQYLHQTDARYADDLPYWSDPTFEARARELVFAAKCLDRYLDWCKAAGRDY